MSMCVDDPRYEEYKTRKIMDQIQPMEKYGEIYEKKKELGRGKFGVVYQVTDKSSGGIMAAKHIKIRKDEHKQRVKEEIGILKNLSNPHVIKFVEAFENERELILVMEYLDGGELFERVATEDFNLTESDCCLFIRQLCRGVDYLHEKQIVHLDLKPENVVCTAKDSTSLKIIDFGLAKKISPTDKLKVMCGTPEFVAPEVVNYDFVDSATDMWSVGVICYILLSGYSPFLGDTDAETYTNISSVQYDFDEPEFDDISENAKEFIRDLLKRRKNSRMTAKMCLEHPWLLEKGIGHQVINTDNLRKYLARRRWQKCGQAIRAIERMTGLMKRSTLSNSNLNSRESTPNMSRTASRDVSPSAERLQPIVTPKESSNEDPTLSSTQDPTLSSDEAQTQSSNEDPSLSLNTDPKLSPEETVIKNQDINPTENQENLPTQPQENPQTINQDNLSAKSQEHALSAPHEITLLDSKEELVEKDESNDTSAKDTVKDEKVIGDESAFNQKSKDTIKKIDTSKTPMDLIVGAIKNVADLSEKVIETQSDILRPSSENETGTAEKESLATTIEVEKDATEIKTDQDLNKTVDNEDLNDDDLNVDDKTVAEKTEDVSRAEQASAGSSADQASAGSSVEQASAGSSAEQASAGSSAEQASAGSSADQPSAGSSAEQASAGSSADQASAGSSKEQPGEESNTAKNLDQSEKTESTTQSKRSKEPGSGRSLVGTHRSAFETGRHMTADNVVMRQTPPRTPEGFRRVNTQIFEMPKTASGSAGVSTGSSGSATGSTSTPPRSPQIDFKKLGLVSIASRKQMFEREPEKKEKTIKDRN